MEEDLIIIVSVFGAALALVLVVLMVLCSQLRSVKKQLKELQARPAMRVQKVTLDPRDGQHAFHNPDIAPDEELSKRGYSMYVGDDVESQRGTERQTGGQFVEELARELESRQMRNEAPPFLLQNLDEKRRTRESASPANPLAKQNQGTLPNNQSKYKEQNNQAPSGNIQRQNSQIQNENGRNQRQNPLWNDDNAKKQNSFLHRQDLQNFNNHLSNHNQRNNVRASDTNPNFIY